MAAVSPQLIPLLRGRGDVSAMAPASAAVEPDDCDEDEEARRNGLGILIAIPIGIAMWAAIGLTFRWAFGL